MAFDLNKHVTRLLMNEPFFAAISRHVEKRSSTAIPTAAVKVNAETATFELLYNPAFFEKLPDNEKAGVLKHEFYHLLLEHVTGRKPDKVAAEPGKYFKLWNYATDLAINSHLVGELPEGCLFPGEGAFEEYPKGQASEWYFQKLLENDFGSEGESGEGDSGEGEAGDGQGNGQPGEGGQSGNGGGGEAGDETGEPGNGGSGGDEDGEEEGNSSGVGEDGVLDDHSHWEQDENSTVKDIARERLKEAVKKAMEEGAKNGFGSCSQGVRQAVTESLLTTKVCWRKLLASFVKRSQRASKNSTVKKINRRYAYIHPGRKVNRQAQLVIAIDQSGSVGDGMLSAFFTELEKLAKFAEFTVIPFDTEVDDKKAFVWKKGQRRKWERVLSGGTNFEPVREWVDNPRARGKEWQGKSFDGVLVLTDMEAPKPGVQRTCQRAWVTTERYARRPYFKPDKRDRLVAIDD